MTFDRKSMERALRAVVVPRMRSLQFAGEFPYFRRKVGAEHQMLMIRFNKYGGSFYMEAGRMSQQFFEDLQSVWARTGKTLEECDLNAGHCKWDERARLGPGKPSPEVDHWFVFGPERGDPEPISGQPIEHFNRIAEQVVQIIDDRVEEFFSAGANSTALSGSGSVA